MRCSPAATERGREVQPSSNRARPWDGGRRQPSADARCAPAATERGRGDGRECMACPSGSRAKPRDASVRAEAVAWSRRRRDERPAVPDDAREGKPRRQPRADDTPPPAEPPVDATPPPSKPRADATPPRAVPALLVAALLVGALAVLALSVPAVSRGAGPLGESLAGAGTGGLERLRSVHGPPAEGDAAGLAAVEAADLDADDGDPEIEVAALRGHAAGAFGPMAFRSVGDGRIEPDPGWVQAHIVEAEVPLLEGTVRCHERLLPQLAGALGELEERGLGELIDPDQYGGCWVPRHILGDPGRALSLHAWGLAVDLNVDDNPYGAEPVLDPRVVETFERWGFAWGGHWRTPDGMHFELVELRDAPRDLED